MASPDFVAECISVAQWNVQGPAISYTESDPSNLSLDDPASNASSSSPPYYVSEAEAMFYYSGLPSNPRLIYRTGFATRPWRRPAGPQAQRELKELRPVFGHGINTAWKDLGPKVRDSLDSLNVLWTSIDVVRFVKVRDRGNVGPVVLWISVAPKTLANEDAHAPACRCLEILEDFRIEDIEVEFRESIYTRSVGPALLKPASNWTPIVDISGPLTPALGLSIASQTCHVQGTGGFYLAQGGDSDKVLLVTARHILFPPNQSFNADYLLKGGAPRYSVVLLGNKAFEELVKSIKIRVGEHAIMAEIYQRSIAEFQKTEVGEDREDAEEASEEREETQRSLDKAYKAMAKLEEFHTNVTKQWNRPNDRVIGHVLYSPRITLGAGAEGFTEDYAVIELDSSKFKTAFRGNVIDLGTEIPCGEFAYRMHSRVDVPTTSTTFEYPYDRLLELRGLIQEDEMRNPGMLDRDGKECLLVIKNGIATRVTIGRATGVFSYVREYHDDGTHEISSEWAILPYDISSGAFSAPGDSGSVIVDGRGRFGGLLTGGAGKADSLDITYATPIFWILQRIKRNGFPKAHLHPTMA